MTLIWYSQCSVVNLLALEALLCTEITKSITTVCRLVSLEDVREDCHYQFLPNNWIKAAFNKFILFTINKKLEKVLYIRHFKTQFLYTALDVSNICCFNWTSIVTPEGLRESRRYIYLITVYKLVFSHKLIESYSLIRYTPPWNSIWRFSKYETDQKIELSYIDVMGLYKLHCAVCHEDLCAT